MQFQKGQTHGCAAYIHICGGPLWQEHCASCYPQNSQLQFALLQIQNTKLKMNKYKMTETKSYTISVTRALWQLLPTEFPSSICFPTNSTPLPKHNNNILHNHKGIYQSHFHFAIGILHDNVTMSNESNRTKRRPKSKPSALLLHPMVSTSHWIAAKKAPCPTSHS